MYAVKQKYTSFPATDRHGTQVSAKQRPSAMPLNNSRLPFTKWKRALGRHRRKWSSKIGDGDGIYSLKLELEKNSVQHGNWIKIKWEIESCSAGVNTAMAQNPSL